METRRESHAHLCLRRNRKQARCLGKEVWSLLARCDTLLDGRARAKPILTRTRPMQLRHTRMRPSCTRSRAETRARVGACGKCRAFASSLRHPRLGLRVLWVYSSAAPALGGRRRGSFGHWARRALAPRPYEQLEVSTTGSVHGRPETARSTDRAQRRHGAVQVRLAVSLLPRATLRARPSQNVDESSCCGAGAGRLIHWSAEVAQPPEHLKRDANS